MPGGIAGNFVGETLLEIRGHQGDVRVDWNASANDKFFARYSFATYEDQRDSNPFPLVLATRNDQPFWNVGGNWNRIFGPSLVNELLVGFSHTTVISRDLDWAGVGAGNALYGIAGGQPIDGLSCTIELGQRPHPRRARSRPTPTRWPRPSRSTRS